MSRRIPFTQADVSRAIKGARSGGFAPSRVEIDQDGKIILLAEKESAQQQIVADANEWDEVLHATQP